MTATKTILPLGLKPGHNLAPELVQKLAYIEAYDMSIERDLMPDSENIDPDDYDLLVREFKRFLALPLLLGDESCPIVPSSAVDRIWHQFIIDTRRYTEFCEAVYGKYLHHEPERTNSLTLARNAGEPFARTKEAYRTVFGELPPRVWGASAKCDRGACRSIPW